jgi:hypothetical protein
MKLSPIISATLAVVTTGWCADNALGDGTRHHQEVIRATLVGFNEVPTLSSAAHGRFRAVVDADAGTIEYELSYQGLPQVTQAHIHFGRKAINGGIVVFLCSNLGNGPPGTQACPANEATLTGTIGAVDVGAGAAAQGIDTGEFAELLAAIRSGSTYANVHSVGFPAGEIRGQVVEVF